MRRRRRIPCLADGMLSGDSFEGLIFFLELLLVVVLEKRSA
jgi:hypothetical protein